MKRNKLFFISIAFALLLLVACNNKPDINMGEILTKSQDQLRQLDEIKTTAAAFNGKSDVKFRLMVEKHPTEEEAIILFNQILDGTITTWVDCPIETSFSRGLERDEERMHSIKKSEIDRSMDIGGGLINMIGHDAIVIGGGMAGETRCTMESGKNILIAASPICSRAVRF
jgi:hypothetical protein